MNVDYDYDYFALGSIWSEGWQVLDRLQNTTKLIIWIDICHLINKAVMKQNCIEAFNQKLSTVNRWKRKLASRVSPETSAIRRPRPLRNETAEQLIGPSDSTAVGWNR